jgi:hypothetical protein
MLDEVLRPLGPPSPMGAVVHGPVEGTWFHPEGRHPPRGSKLKLRHAPPVHQLSVCEVVGCIWTLGMAYLCPLSSEWTVPWATPARGRTEIWSLTSGPGPPWQCGRPRPLLAP